MLFTFSISICLSLSFMVLPAVLTKGQSIDSLRNELSKAKTIDHKVDLHLTLYKNMNKASQDSAIFHLKSATKLVQSNVSNTTKVKTWSVLAEHHLDRHQYDSVYYLIDQALGFKSELDPRLLVALYSMQGKAYYFQSEYLESIASLLKATEISDQHNLNIEKAKSLHAVGRTYIKLENWPKAEEYTGEALRLWENLDLKERKSYSLGNLGIIYGRQGKYDQAIEMYRQSLKINEEVGDSMALARNYTNLGVLFERKNDLEQALFNYKRGFKINEKLSNKYSLAIGYHNIASVLSKLENFRESKHNYERSLVLAQSLGNKDLVKNIYLGLAEMFEDSGDLKNAIDSRRSYENWKDSIVNENHLKAISELEIKYETEKKENDILLLSQEKLNNETELKEQQAWIRRLVSSLIAIAVLFIAVFIIFRQRSRNQKQKELITAISDTQISERKRIAQDLHDSVGGSLALAKNKLSALYEKEGHRSKEIEESLETLSQTGEQVRQISHNLMPGELVKFGLVSAIQATLDQLAETSLGTHLYTHDMEQRLDPAKEVHLYRLIQEIIHNVIKHAQATNLDVHLNKHKKHLSLMVEDDGIGMEPEMSKNNGIGLGNIKTRVDYLNGTFDLDSNKGRGTTVTIQVPL